MAGEGVDAGANAVAAVAPASVMSDSEEEESGAGAQYAADATSADSMVSPFPVASAMRLHAMAACVSRHCL